MREYLYYSALLQLPGFLYKKRSAVEDAIHAMSLGDYANKLIGGHCYMKGLRSGERRRVTIARELVMRPHILFIDEPLYHLDRFLKFLFPVLVYYAITHVYMQQFCLCPTIQNACSAFNYLVLTNPFSCAAYRHF